MNKSYDAIIIGAGIMGSCAAFELAGRGLKVALLDKMTIGEGPTGQSSSIVRQHYSNKLTARMARHSLQVFQNLKDIVGDECGFSPVGFIVLVDAKDRAGLEANVALQRSVGIETELLSTEGIRELLPQMETADLVAAAWEEQSGYADPYLTVTAYARAAKLRGADVLPDTEVTGVRFQSGKVVGIDTPKFKLDAPLVINTAGSWGGQVAEMAGVRAPINACRVQVAFFKRPSGHEAVHPVVGDFINTFYVRPETGGLSLIGLIDPGEAKAIVDPDAFNQKMDSDFVLEAGDRLIRRYPAMDLAESTGGFASLYGITPDWHPIIDETPSGSGLYTCAGFSGHGFKLGPAVSIMLADLVLAKAEPEFDASMFCLSRFDKGALIQGQYEYSIVG